ncbi:MAG: autotransporter outer membrane beta-barrel domain-containing protein [Verrucomicrobiales bacterium]|jgi:outer membrane autotransporter protein|nr:autotransporter outer membrane beta-barrel domain-containing protein [Verrucomicrobiales bacterium]
MNTPILKTLTRILTFCALSASALNVFADNKVVNTGTVTESDRIYESTDSYAALQVSGSGVQYSGTNITLSATHNNGNGRFGANVYEQGSLVLYSSTISALVGPGVRVYGTSTAHLENISITVVQTNQGIYVENSSVYLKNFDVTTNGGTGIVISTGSGTFSVLDSGTITTSGEDAWGLMASGTLIANDLTVKTSGTRGRGVVVTGDGYVELNRATIECLGLQAGVGGIGESSAAALLTTGAGQIIVNDSDIRSSAAGVLCGGNGGSVELNNSSLSVTGTNVVLDMSGIAKSIIVRGGTLSSQGGDLLHVENRVAGATYVILSDVDTTTAGGIVTGTNFVTGTMNILINGGSGIIGDVTNSGGGALTLSLNDSALTGDVFGSNDSTITITGSNNATISGTVSGNDNAVIDVTVSGPGSSFTGDLTQSDHSQITITITDGATGRGAWDGGNLNLGTNSEWTITDNSRLNDVTNAGTITIGDHQVTVDNLTNDGTITINLDNDSGEGGALTVTGTADGAGKIHLNATGDGQANPNQVLPNVVTGNGTEHWTWDEVNWGLETLIVTPNPDGTITVKEDGVSPAGAVLNSAIAVQQSMWFAQQNSLLKRMGELRYGTRASRPQADKDVRAPYNSLIENIWIRSYGQQLNIGSQVAGKAYEQLIYGVDLGTDHKFTINADSDLYLGVYAGYGRSDLDYRTPGTDGEINSYYGGLYATWLHSSGFYIDATFKAASVNNDLKAPYGNTQLTASYSDVNLGGSIEIGNKFTFTDDWFIEPQLQVNYLHILAENYQAGPMTISAQDLDALQFRIGSLFGRTINLTNSGALQPYIKVSGVETISSGGTIRNGYQHTRANTDGARAEVGGGIIWQLDANNQLHLDYEASFGDKYDKPWGLTAGYRHQF